jgi:hypothetical protein
MDLEYLRVICELLDNLASEYLLSTLICVLIKWVKHSTLLCSKQVGET